MDNLDLILNKFKNDNFAKKLGIVVDDLTENMVRMHVTLTPDMNNFNGRPHGAAIYALADAAFSVIGNNQNNLSVALNCTIHYLASPDTGQVLYVEGNLIKLTRKIGTFYFELYTLKEEEKNIVATMISSLYRTGKPHDPNLEVK